MLLIDYGLPSLTAAGVLSYLEDEDVNLQVSLAIAFPALSLCLTLCLAPGARLGEALPDHRSALGRDL